MSAESRQRRFSLFSVYFTFAVDTLGTAIVFPIFGPLFLESGYGLIPPSLAPYRSVLLGCFLMIFPFLQLFLSPILGEYADGRGRKRSLLWTSCLTTLGFALSAWSIYERSVTWLFLSRIVMGIGSGNLSVCLSALADLSRDERHKPKYYGYGAAISGLVYVVGPFVGGKLADPEVFSLADPSLPMMLGAFLAFCNVFFILFAFRETFRLHPDTHFDPMQGIRNIFLALKNPAMKDCYSIYFFYLFSWNVILLFAPAVAVRKFALSENRVGEICALMALCWIFGTTLLRRFFHTLCKARYIASGSFLFYGLSIFSALFFMHRETILLVLLGICAVTAGLAWPFCVSRISDVAPATMQGKVLGLSQSVSSVATLLSALCGGIALGSHVSLLLALSGVSALVALGFTECGPRKRYGW
ncbi:MAG: MFS transporter [Simkaniaceae bacterium]|nr:MFS transporter [Simkaniaceae bacterium]